MISDKSTYITKVTTSLSANEIYTNVSRSRLVILRETALYTFINVYPFPLISGGDDAQGWNVGRFVSPCRTQ